MKKLRFAILPLLFILVLISPFVNDVFSFWEFERSEENRNPVEKPVLNMGLLDPYPNQYEKYYDDHFAFRSPLLDVNSWLKYNVFSTSPHPEKSVIGKDDWYFMSQKEKQIYEGKLDFTEGDLKKFDELWSFRKSKFDSLGIKYYWLIAPMKHYAYEDKLPFHIIKSKNGRRVDLLTDHLTENFGDFIIDPLPLFDENEEKLYYRQDNHWNEKAGFISSQLLIERISKDFPEVIVPGYDDYKWIDSTKVGGIHPMLMGMDGVPENDKWAHQKNFSVVDVEKCGFPVEENFPYPGVYELRFQREGSSNLPRVLIIRDSFAEQMEPFLISSFGETLLIFDSWQYKYKTDIIEEYSPDIVVFIGLETHLENMFVDLKNKN